MNRRQTIRRIRHLSLAFAGSLCALAVLTVWKTLPGFPASVTTGFPDVPSSRTDYQAILYVQSRGVMTGYSSGKFGPDDTIKRGEISALLVRALVNPAAVDNCTMSSFPDVDPKEWYAKYICTAKAVGFVSGYPDGNFRPGQAITAAEVSKIIALGFKLPITTTAASADQWYMPYVNALMTARAFPPTLRTPEQQEERGEVAQTLAVLIPPETPTAGENHAAAGTVSSAAGTTAASSKGTKSALQIAMEEAQKRLLEEIQNAQNTSTAGMWPTTGSSASSAASVASTASQSSGASQVSSVSSVSSVPSSSSSSSAAASSSSLATYTHSSGDTCTTTLEKYNLADSDITAVAMNSVDYYTYFGAGRYVYKVNNQGNGNMQEELLLAGVGETITAAAIDEDYGFGYFATTNFTNTQTESKIYRVNLNNFSVLDSASIEGVYQTMNMQLDMNHGYIVILGYDNYRNRNVISSLTMTGLDVRGDYTFTGSTAERNLFVDTMGGMAYAGSATMYEIRLWDMMLMDTIDPVRSSVSLHSGVIDEELGVGYFGNYPSSGDPSVFAVNLGPFDLASESIFSPSVYTIGSLTPVPPTALAAYSPKNHRAYFISSNGVLIRINTLDMSAMPERMAVNHLMDSGEAIGVVAIDDANDLLLLGTTKGADQTPSAIEVPLDYWDCD